MDPGTDHLTDHQEKIIHSIHPKTLDQITEATITQVIMTTTTGRTTAKTTAGTETTNNNRDTNRETKTTQTGMTITKIEKGTKTTKTDTSSTTEGDQTSINITQKPTQSSSYLRILRPKCNGNDAEGKRIH